MMTRYLRTMRTFDYLNFFSGIKFSCLRAEVGHWKEEIAPRAAISPLSKHLHLPAVCGMALPSGKPNKPQTGKHG